MPPLVNKTINPIDKHFGMRLRARRGMMGMSQEKLGETLGVSFQQVQKYERGVNRISAASLYFIAQALETSVGFFYEGLPIASPSPTGFSELGGDSYIADIISTPEGMRLYKCFGQIQDSRVRRAILALVDSLSRISATKERPDPEAVD
jgi:transcriptional regulator with XRE-family HTH domain